MIMDELISVIIPVYKVEPFLEQCIRSVTKQTYKELEIILVDDGSPDKCPAICDEWRKKDNRIHVIHQENCGGGDARNKALDIARGKYIVFVDSDDYISPIMLEFLYQQFQEDIDVVECGYITTTDEEVSFDELKASCNIQYFTAEAAMKENIKDGIFRQLIWNKMYRRSVIGDIRFPVGKKIDDEFWTYQVIGNANKLIFTDKVLYAYRQQGQSVMHSLNMSRRLEAVEAKIQRHKYICRKMPILEEMSLCNVWGTCIYQGQLALQTLNEKEQKEILEYLQEVLNNYPIKGKWNRISFKQKIWLKMACLSFRQTCRLKNLLKVGM